MDVSDGLAGDLQKLCQASGVRAEIAVGQVPLSRAARAVLDTDPGAIETILTGGDDYEILCTIAEERSAEFRRAAAAVGVPVTDIGRIVEGQGTAFIALDGSPLTFARPSFSHF
jgi:thiamine-monophosphate kinase